ncbi:MAG: helix-turn-helix transcriptional regulator [Polyangiaceae bacterium]
MQGAPPPKGLRATVMTIDGQTLLVLSHELAEQPAVSVDAAVALTATERAIAEMLHSGATYKKMAEVRGTSIATIRKQVHALYTKLGISSRRELLGAEPPKLRA